jgi:hypothetical protein
MEDTMPSSTELYDQACRDLATAREQLGEAIREPVSPSGERLVDQRDHTALATAAGDIGRTGAFLADLALNIEREARYAFEREEEGSDARALKTAARESARELELQLNQLDKKNDQLNPPIPPTPAAIAARELIAKVKAL